MILRFTFIVSIFLFLCACHPKATSGTKTKTGDCLTEKMEEFKKTSCEKGATVKEYTFQGKQVFVFEPGNCGNDMTSEVIDDTCKNMDFLGGFSGNMRINGVYFSEAVYVKTIWEK